jgi:alkylmercury lyase
MLSFTLDEIIAAWQEAKKREYLSPEQRAFELAILRTLADGRPVSPEQIAASTRLPVNAVRGIFQSLREGGADFDVQGNLVGTVLTLIPTPHEFRVNNKQLYAWCALDTLFLPGLVGAPAEVISTCPATGTEVRLTITPEGIDSARPAEGVLSVVVPGFSAVCKPGQPGGAQGPVCSSMHFFRDRQAASTWLVAQPDLAVLALNEAWELARRAWID